jgi:hypothetical protein
MFNKNEHFIWTKANTSIRNILMQFGMVESKLLWTPFMTNCKLLKDMGLQSDVDFETMQPIPFQNVIGNLMYEIVCIRLHVAH